jgi:hypothetical protein
MKMPPGVPGFVVARSTLGAGFRTGLDVSLCVIIGTVSSG